MMAKLTEQLKGHDESEKSLSMVFDEVEEGNDAAVEDDFPDALVRDPSPRHHIKSLKAQAAPSPSTGQMEALLGAEARDEDKQDAAKLTIAEELHASAPDGTPDSHRETAEERDYGARPEPAPVALTLPPYVVMRKVDGKITYLFMVPGNVRPKNWQVTTDLATDDGKGAGGIVQKAWRKYAELLYAMHAEKLSFEREMHPKTLEDAEHLYKESDEFRAMPHHRMQQFVKNMKRVNKWMKLNAHPPMFSIMPAHIYAFMLSQDIPHAERVLLRNDISRLFDTGIKYGFNETNPVAKMPMPHPDWRPTKHPVHIFARKPGALELFLK